MKATANELLLARAGRLADRHAMFWIRTLKSPVEDVWSLVSTREGLARWWIVPPSVFDLRIGGDFKHHWDNTIVDFRDGDFIDFSENTAAYDATGGMRFELAATGSAESLFMFMDTWDPGMTPPEGVGDEQPGIS